MTARGGAYDIDDVTGFGAGITLDGPPDVTYVPISDGASPVSTPAWTKIADQETIAGQKSESWQVVADFIIDPKDDQYEANRECEGEGSSLVSGKGFYNKVDLSDAADNDLTNNQICGSVPGPNINLAKTVNGSATLEQDGTYTVFYTITASNPADNGPGIYDVIDTFSPLSGITLKTATATYAGGSIGESETGTPGAYKNFVTDEALGGGANESWTVEANFRVDANLDPQDITCDPNNPEIDTGFYNFVSGVEDEENLDDNDTCTGTSIINRHHPVPIMNHYQLLVLILMVLALGTFGSRRFIKRA